MDLTGQSFTDKYDDTYRRSVTVDGVVCGVPFASTQAGAVMYYKPIYEKLGLEIPYLQEGRMKVALLLLSMIFFESPCQTPQYSLYLRQIQKGVRTERIARGKFGAVFLVPAHREDGNRG